MPTIKIQNPNPYVFVSLSSKKFIGSDSYSGGYPHLSDRIESAAYFESAADALRWLNPHGETYLNEKVALYKIKDIELEEVDTVAAIDSEYQKELAVLRKKYGLE